MDVPWDDVARQAYLRWLQKGKPTNSQSQDWLEAEAEVRRSVGLARRLTVETPNETSRLLQAILDNSPAVIYVKDALGRYLLINRLYEVLFRVRREELLGKTDYAIFAREAADALRRNDLQVLSTNQPLECEENVPHEDGIHTYISLKFPIHSPDGAPCAVCGISTDITTRKRTRRRLEAEHAVTQVLAESASLEEAAPSLLQSLCLNLGYELGLLWEVDRTADVLRCVGVWHEPQDTCGMASGNRSTMATSLAALCGQAKTARGVGLAGQVWATREPVWSTDGELSLPGSGVPGSDNRFRVSCAFPVGSSGRVLGVIQLSSRSVHTPDEEQREVLESIGCQIGQFLDRRLAEKTLHERENEFRIARRIQQSLLPPGPPTMPGFEIGGASRPAQETGGDYFDFISGTTADKVPGSLFLAVGDASGHGIGAALLMAETHAFLRARVATDSDVGGMAALLNTHLMRSAGVGHFVTLLLARLDPRSRVLEYTSAGHPPGYVLDADGKVRTVLRSLCPPLGVEDAGRRLPSSAVTLYPGELVVLLTDGIPEAFAPDGGSFGVPRLLDLIRDHRRLSPQEITTAVLRDVARFSVGEQVDDQTLVILKVQQTT